MEAYPPWKGNASIERSMIPVKKITTEWYLTEKRCDGNRGKRNPTRHTNANGHGVGAQQEETPIMTDGIDNMTGTTMVGIEKSKATAGSDGGSLIN